MIYDLIVIGAGAAGSKAALAAAELGMKTLLVEQAFVGGTCVNAGCIPTKLLLGYSSAIPQLAAQQKLKTLSGEITADILTMQERKNRYIKGLRSALEKSFATAGIEHVHGRAAFSGPKSLKITPSEGEAFKAEFKKCIVATGSTPASFPGLKADGANVMTSTGLLNLSEVPESLIIVGGGVIGLELGAFYWRLGTKITVVEAMERIALSEDPEIAAALHKQLGRDGWSIHVSRRVKSVTSEGEEALLTFEDGEELRASKAMIAVGRAPGSKNLELEEAGLKTFRAGWIEIDQHLLAAPDIYAVGDVNGRVLLAHAGEHQAEYAVRHAAGLEKEAYDDSAMPACVYGHHEMMHVGAHAGQLAETFKDKTVEVSNSQLIANPISQSYGTTHGFVKIAWVDGRVYSVAAWGHGVSHLVGLATVMVKEHWDDPKIIFAHPTLDEALKNALLAKRQPVNIKG